MEYIWRCAVIYLRYDRQFAASCVAAPRIARKGEAWWAQKDKTGHWMLLIQLPLLKWRRQKPHEKPRSDP